MGRKLGLIAAMLALVAGGAGTALAQDATPMAADALFADTMGLPEIRVTQTDTTYEGVPAELPAGRYVVTITNNATQGDAIAEFVQLPEGVTFEDVLALVGASSPDATPDAGEASPAVEGSPAAAPPDVPPDWFYEVHLAGGAAAEAPGVTAQAIVDLRPGTYVVWDGNPDNPQGQAPPAQLRVTGDAASPAAAPEPAADVTIREVKTDEGYAFELEGELAPGPQVIEVVNDADQPHFFILIRSPGPITRDQALALLMLNPSTGATPPPGLPDPTAFVETAGVGTQSAGTTQWLATNLEPGYYVIACFIPDPTRDYIPHAFEGMIDVIQVGDVAGTPTP